MYPFVVTIVYPVRTAASQAVKTGSNPVGDASFLVIVVLRAQNYAQNSFFLGVKGATFAPFLFAKTCSIFSCCTPRLGSTPKTGASPFNGQIFRQVSDQFPSHFSSTKRAHAGGNFRSCESHTHAAGSTSFCGENLL